MLELFGVEVLKDLRSQLCSKLAVSESSEPGEIREAHDVAERVRCERSREVPGSHEEEGREHAKNRPGEEKER